MCTQELKIGTIPAVLYGEPAPDIWLFVHGQGGNKTEAAAFAALAAPTGWQVLGIDLPEHGDRTGETDFTPWQVVPELQTVLAYLQQREEAAKSQLDDYLSELGEGVKETWLERGFSEDLLPGIRRLSLPATAQTQDIVQLVCRQEEKLIGELSHLARECPTEETVRLLGGLAEQEQTRLTRLVHGVHRLDDM